MAASYKKIDPRIWTDEVFDSLDRDEAFAALWLITSRATNRAGVAFFALTDATDQLRIDGIDTAWNTLSTLSEKMTWPVERMGRNKVVMILRAHFRYNPPCNEKHLRGQLSDLADIPRCRIIESEYVKTVRPYLDKRWRAKFDTFCDTLSGTISNTLRAGAHVTTSTSEATSEEPLTPRSGDTVSPRAKKLNPRALGTNPRALAAKAAAAEDRRRSELIDRCRRKDGTRLADGRTVESVGVYDPRRGMQTWNKLTTDQLERVEAKLYQETHS